MRLREYPGGLATTEVILGSSDFHSQSLGKWERLKKCLHRALLAFPENAKFHRIVLIVAQLIEGLPAAAIRNHLS